MQATQRLSAVRRAAGQNRLQATALTASVPRQRVLITAAAATLPVRTVAGEDAGSATLDLKVAKAETAKGLVHRYIVYTLQNNRKGTASTKTRAEVRGGGRKPYAQKGSGNARRGSNTTPLMPGGGVSFGPKPKDWSIKMNKKERRLALATALQSAAADTLVVEGLADKLTDKKTKSLVTALEKVGVSPGGKTLLILSEKHEHVMLAGRNIANLTINTSGAISAFDVLNADKIVVEQPALQAIQAFYGVANTADADTADDQPAAEST